MTEPMVKCRYCGEKIPKSFAEVIEGKQKMYVCPQHLTLYQELIQAKKRNSKELRDITDYLQSIYQGQLGMSNNEVQWSRLVADIKQLISDGYKQSGILLTLKYVTENKNLQWQKDYGIQKIVEGYYNEAKDNYVRTRELNQLCEDFEEDNVVTITTHNHNSPTYQRFMIDMNELNEE